MSIYLLQIDESNARSYYILGYIIAFLISIFLTRWIFRIDTIVDNMQRQTKLLAKIAKYGNVPESEIRDVLGLNEVSSSEPLSTASAEFENQISKIITESGTIAAISAVANQTGVSSGSARSYVDELITKRHLTPKN
jgi:hypothetical protein